MCAWEGIKRQYNWRHSRTGVHRLHNRRPTYRDKTVLFVNIVLLSVSQHLHWSWRWYQNIVFFYLVCFGRSSEISLYERLAEYGVNITMREGHEHGIFIYVTDKMIKSKQNEMDGACVTVRKMQTRFLLQNMNSRYHFGALGVDAQLILKLILQ